jgi:hypothetical protein
MALVDCPECGHAISDRAKMCPNCGLPIGGGLLCWEYRSEAEFFGLPLIHIVYGLAFDPTTGRPRIAKGIIAIGPMAAGVVAIGGVAFGGFCLGGVALGLVAVAGCAVGLGLALGGLAIGGIALGGCAIGYYALGGGAFGAHALGANARDPEAIRFFKDLLGDWVEQLGQGRSQDGGVR